MTTPHDLLSDLWRQGIALRLAGDGQHLAAPAGKLTPEQRERIKSHKPGLIALLQEAHETTALLVATAMRACDHHGDTDEAREQMRADCLNTPPHLRADLLAHFQQTYQAKP